MARRNEKSTRISKTGCPVGALDYNSSSRAARDPSRNNPMGKSPEEMLESMVQNLKKTTGKSLDEWIKITKPAKLAKHGEIVTMLKIKHGIGHGYANLIAHKTLGSDAGSAESTDDLVQAQYAGAKAGL